MLTHAATALHAAGDTAALRRLISRIQEHGSRSGYGRDPRLHRHARGLLWSARGRPAEAVAILRPALRGSLEASNLYVTRTELHEALGRAFEAAGQPDSAAKHYR